MLDEHHLHLNIIATGRVTAHWQADENLPALLDLPYEKVVPAREDLSDEMKLFYHQCHLKAVRAMLEYIYLFPQ